MATRVQAARSWRVSQKPVASGSATTIADDRPSIAVDDGAQSPHRGRLYIGWTRFDFDRSSIWADPDAEDVQSVDVKALFSHSDDGGRHWSNPSVLSALGMPLEARFAVGKDGTVYAVWRDAKTNSVYVARSPDGSHVEGTRLVAAATVEADHSCQSFRARIPAQPRRCVSPNPTISVDTSGGPHDGRVYVVWGSTSLNRSQDVYVAAFDPALEPKLGVGHVVQVNPPEKIRGPDQFLPTSSVDERSGRLWVCYYQTTKVAGRLARFTCTASDDGGHSWLTPVPATSAFSNESKRPANVANGYGDYESATVAAGKLVAVWTDGHSLRSHGEEIYSTELKGRVLKEPR